LGKEKTITTIEETAEQKRTPNTKEQKKDLNRRTNHDCTHNAQTKQQ